MLFSEYDFKCSTAETQGDVGEVVTARAIRSELGMNVVRNIYIPYNNHFTEIDMIAISESGVFVIENKNYSGIISGIKDDKFWFAKYGYKCNSFLNPIKQNDIHIEALNSIILDTEFSDLSLNNIVIFNDNANLSSLEYMDNVFYLSDFINYFRTSNSKFIDKNKVMSFYYFLLNYSDQSSEMKEQHVSLLRSSNGVRRV